MSGRRIPLLSVATVALTLTILGTGDRRSNPAPTEHIQDGRLLPSDRDTLNALLRGDSTERQHACRAWESSRRELTGQMLRVLERPGALVGPFDAREAAARILGEMRSIEALPVLVERVGWRFGSAAQYDLTLLHGYPCAEAIRAIGLDAVPFLLWRLTDNRRPPIEDGDIEIISRIVLEIYGTGSGARNGGPDEALAVVERFIRKVPTAEQNSRAGSWSCLSANGTTLRLSSVQALNRIGKINGRTFWSAPLRLGPVC